MTARHGAGLGGRRAAILGPVGALERFLVPEELLPDGSTDWSVVRLRYRRMVRTVAGLSAGLFVATLWPAGVPFGDWVIFTVAVIATAGLISAVLNRVPPESPLSVLGALAIGASVFALDRLIGGSYHEAPLLFALVVAGSSIIQGIPAALALVMMGAVLVPRASPVALDAPIAPVDHLFALLYLLGIAAIVWTYRRLAYRGAAAVRASREEYRDLVERVPAVVYTSSLEPAMAWRYVSPRVAEITGEPAEALAGDPEGWRRHVHPDDLAYRLELAPPDAAAGARVAAEYRIVASDGGVRWVLDEAELVGGPGEPYWSGLLHDVTGRRDLESQLRQSQRLESVGRLTGGVAHDFNNMLTAIRGFGELVETALPAGSAERADMVEVLAAADRAAALTRQLLAFSRRQSQRPEVLDPADAVEVMAPMLRRLLGEHIELVVRRSPEPCHVRMDLSQLEQVVLNLAVNAAEAMPDGGRFEVGASTVVAEAPDGAQPGQPTEPRQFARLRFADTGRGMDAETAAHAFEPYFTTKGPGEGSGLGLATVYGIVTQSGGRVEYRSAPGAGTEFTVDLPRVPAEPRAPRAERAAFATPGRERVLVVEDEPAVRELTCRMLLNMGYRVQSAASGPEALDLVLGGAELDLLLTDVRMPAMQGPELARRVLDLRPGTRVLMMSGFVGGAEGTDCPSTRQILGKPFDSAALSAAVRAALDPKR